MTNSYETTDKSKPNNLAIACVLLGFFSVVMLGAITGLPAVIIGHSILARIKREPDTYLAIDKKLAYGGLFLGYLGVVMTIVFGWIVWVIS